MKRNLRRWMPLLAIATITAIGGATSCLYSYPDSSGAGGATASHSSASGTPTTTTKQSSTTASSSTTTSSSDASSSDATTASESASSSSGVGSSSSTGLPPDPLYLYKHAYPLNQGGWSKVSFATEYGTDPNVPTDHIVAASNFQASPILLLLTNDNNVHMRKNGNWSTTPIDTFLPLPAVSCKKDDLAPCDGSGDTGTCTKISQTAVSYMTHLPDLSGACGSGGTNEGLTVIGPTIATAFTVTSLGVSTFQVQRDFHMDCFADAYASNVYFRWGFEIIDPTRCGMDGDWYQTYMYTTDGVLRYSRADTPSGQNAGAWTNTDPNNPIFKTPPDTNQPDPSTIVAAYSIQGPMKTGTLVLIAP